MTDGSVEPDASVIGRESEVDELDRFLAAHPPTSALVLTGQAGIGKTTLWEAAVAIARRKGLRVLATKASAAETQLSFSGLADLLEGIDFERFEQIPAPQRHALDVALLRADATGTVPDAEPLPNEPLAIRTGFLSVIRALEARDAILIAVDDLPWLDDSTSEALTFAARRLRGGSVRFLLARRTGPQSDLERALDPARIGYVEVSALSFGAIRRLLLERLGLNPPRRLLRTIFETSQGNPLFALELGRGLGEHAAADAELHLPDALDDLFGPRVLDLAEPLRRVLLAVALSGNVSRSQLEAAVDPVAVEDACTSGLVTVDGERARPSHPLLGAAAIRHATADERRTMHASLASASGDEVMRARHLALATIVPDEQLADIVADAAVVAMDRSAIHEAVELAEQAYRLTPSSAPLRENRLVTLAQYLTVAGRLTAAQQLLLDRFDELVTEEARARAHLLLADAASTVAETEDHLDRALAETDAPAVRVTVLATKARILALYQLEQVREAETLALEAVGAAGVTGSPEEGTAIATLAWVRVMRGGSLDDVQARSRSDARLHRSYETSIDRPAGVQLAFRGHIDEARALFEELRSSADSRGEDEFVSLIHLQLCELELRAGDARAAERLIINEWDQMRAAGRNYDQIPRCRALLVALQGRPEEAERWATEAVRAKGDDRWCLLEVGRARGLAALFAHDAERAVQALGPVWDDTQREGIDDPEAFPVAPDLVEALVEIGDTERARSVTDRLLALAEAQLHPWGLASSKRCGALLRLASNDVDGATAQLEEAASEYGALGLRFDRARTLLLLGRALRRHRKRRAARHALEDAAGAFDELGCPGWAEQTREELARLGSREPTPGGKLTPAEQRVVALAASGMSNKEIARRLFVSVHTVEVHLAHAYAKLGVRSRAGLASRLASSGEPPVEV